MRTRFSCLGLALAAGMASSAVAQTTFNEVEDNNTKAQANAVNGIVAGDNITGTTTGSSTITVGLASADNFRVKTAPAALGIYRHRLTLTTTGTAGHTGTIRGLTQTAGVINAGTDVAFQTSSTTATTPARSNVWFGFGKEEEIYYRVTGSASTTAPYVSTLTTDTITPTYIGDLATGTIAISTIGETTVDTDMWLYDGNLDAIADAGNDDESVAGGGTGATLQSLLTRNLAPGTYYLAITSFSFANNLPSPPDDDFRTGSVLDFPNAAASSSTTQNQAINFKITDSSGTVRKAAVRTPFDIHWYRFTVGQGMTGACCLGDGTCSVMSVTACGTAGGVYAGDSVTCAAANCPAAGACCSFQGTCTFVTQTACASSGGTYQGDNVTCGAANCPSVPPVVFSNCGLSTGATTLNGVAAPAGATWSEVARYTSDPTSANTNAGSAGSGAFRLADDFVVPTGGMNLGYVRLPIYTTGAANPTTTAVNLQIWDGPPGQAGSNVVFGDTTTNRLAHVEFSNIYRTFNTVAAPTCNGTPTAPGTTRRIQHAYVTVNQTLPAGTYWIDFNYTGGSFSPTATSPTAIGSQCNPANANAMQFNAGWVAVMDAGQGCTPVPSTQDLYFELLGTVNTGPTCYPNCDGSTNNPFLNVLDFNCFLNAFNAAQTLPPAQQQTHYSNCDGSTSSPILNVLDFNCFLNSFNAGCTAP